MISWHRISTVHASADEAFEIIGTNVTVNHPRWEKEVQSIRTLTPGPVRVGTRAVMVRKEMGRIRESEYEVTEFAPGTSIAFRHPQDGLDFAVRFQLTPIDSTTCELTVDVTAQPKGALRIMAPLMRLGFPRRSAHITDAMIAVIEDVARRGTDEQFSMTHPNAELIQKGYRAFGAGDIPAILEIFDPGITWHVPGRSPISGDFKGHDGVLDFFGRCQELSGGTLRIAVDETLADGERVVVLCTVSAQRGDRFWSSPEVQVWRVVDGRAVEFREFQGDQESEDAFWSA